MALNSTEYGQNDWYLPSSTELIRAFQKNTIAGLNLGGGHYWSSSNYISSGGIVSATKALATYKNSSGAIYTVAEYKSVYNFVRLIRKF